MRDTERQSMNGVRAEREGDPESEAGSRLRAVSTDPNAGLKLTNREIMTWTEVGRLTDWATQAPHWVLYVSDESLNSTPETIITLYVN